MHPSYNWGPLQWCGRNGDEGRERKMCRCTICVCVCVHTCASTWEMMSEQRQGRGPTGETQMYP